MEYAMLAQLVLQVGLPLALKLAENFQKKGAITPEEIAELRAMGEKTAMSQMRDAILRAGLNPEDPKAKELLALVTPKA